MAATQQAAAKLGVTHFNYFYAVYLVLLSRITGSRRVCTTFQSNGRRAFAGAAAGVQGVFSNSLILATEVDETASLAALAGRMRGEIREAIAHEIYPYHHVIRRTGIHPRYAINWYPESPTVTLEGVEFQSLSVEQNQDDDDLNFRFVTYGGDVRLVLYYDPALFGADRVAALVRQLAGLAQAFADNLDTPIADVRSADLAPPGVLPDPAAALPAPGEARIFDGFLAAARRTPEAPALVQGARALTYGELERRSAELAAALAARGLAAGDRVALVADRSPELVVSMLAAARLGAVLTVLDSDYPEPRLARLAAIVAPHGIIATAPGLRALSERLAEPTRAHVFAASDAGDTAGVRLDAARAADPAYFLFTSGSTGQPRGVACSHQPLTHFLAWQASTYGLARDDRFTLLSGLAHDPMLRDVFAPLSLGAPVVIPEPQVVRDPARLASWIAAAEATVAHLTPPLGQVLAAGAGKAHELPALRRIFWGGDVLTQTVVDALRELAPGAAQTNFYGATETPQAAGAFDIAEGAQWAATPIGRGPEGVQLLVLGPDGRQRGVGELGEIAVRSAFLTLGDLDAGRIRPAADRVSDVHGEPTIHPTGDLGLYLPDGSVMYRGRRDDQVKVRGHRVHLSEVTAALAAWPGVRSAAVAAVGEGADLTLTAFVTGPAGLASREDDIRAALAARLPDYMIPQRVCRVETLPLTPNGKVDKAALVAGLQPAPAPAADTEASTQAERDLIAKWGETLGVAVTRQSTFSSLGGDSLSYVRGYLAAEEVAGDLPADWHRMTVAELAALSRPAASARSSLDAPVLSRAVAILLVVLGHYQILSYGGGATGALMLVSGFMFSLPLRDALEQRSGLPILRSARNIFVPTLVLSLAVLAYRWPDVMRSPALWTFTADFQDYTIAANHPDMYLWYVHGLLHMLLLAYVLFEAARLVFPSLGMNRFLAIAFGLGCLGRFVLPFAWDPGFFSLTHGMSERTYFLPTSNFATLALGALIATADGPQSRNRLWLLLAAYSLASAAAYGPSQAAFIFAAGSLQLFLPSLAMPRPLRPVVLALARASLWIYLTHLLVREALRDAGYAEPGLGGAILAIGLGVAVSVAWNWAWAQARVALKRPDSQAEAAV